MLSDAERAACPAPAQAAIERYAAGDLSAEMALMHLLLALGGAAAATQAAKRLAATASRPCWNDLVRLAARHSPELARAGDLVRAGLADSQWAGQAQDSLSRIGEQFDRAVAVSPEASVALYSLGSAEILERATQEILDRLRAWNLLAAGSAVLDLGCGIGRVARAIAPHVGSVVGIDISPGMIAEAQRRSGEVPNLSFVRGSGRDLAVLGTTEVDLILAVDSFPYLVDAGPAVVDRHVADAARLLTGTGVLLILNYSYRGDLERDRADLRALADRHGFVVERLETGDFTLWDGATFLLRCGTAG